MTAKISVEPLKVDLQELDLDLQNPRFNPESTQTGAMRSLLLDPVDSEKIAELAGDICEVGMLDPGDKLYVIASDRDEGRYIVLDGNRRLMALKLLSQPALLDRLDIGLTPQIRQRIKRLRDTYPNSWPIFVDVTKFETRGEANRFIRLRHTGQNRGAGRSAWSALQIARFDVTGTWQCLDLLREQNMLDLSVITQLDRSTFNISSFERVAVTSTFQRMFSFSIHRDKFKFGDDEIVAKKALAKLALDVASGRVTSRGEFEEAGKMGAYFEEVSKAVRASESGGNAQQPERSNERPITPPPSGSSEAGARTKPSANERDGQADIIPEQGAQSIAPASNPTSFAVSSVRVRKPRMSKYLIGKKDLPTVTNLKCRKILDELKEDVEFRYAPYAAALLLRSLLEMTSEIYLRTLEPSKLTSNKTTNITQAALHLLSNPSPKTDPANRIDIAKMFQASSGVYDQLCQTAHSTVSEISGDHLRATWANVRDGLDLLWRRIHSSQLSKATEE